jgi:hypothetical protein
MGNFDSDVPANPLASGAFCPHFLAMLPPTEPVTLNAEQVAELNKKLSTMRHDINNNLSLIIAASELIQHKPEVADKMLATIALQPGKISEALAKFSAEFEKTFGIVRK